MPRSHLSLPKARRRWRRSDAARASLNRWLHAHSIAFAPEQLGLEEGLRAAVVVTIMVLVAHILHYPALGWAAFSAFWTCLVDPGEADRARLRVMLTVVVGGAALIALAAYFATLGRTVTVSALFLMVSACCLIRCVTPSLAQVGVLMNVAIVVAVDSPSNLAKAATLGAIYFGGGTIAIVLNVFIWPIRPDKPARRAVSGLFRALEEMVGDFARIARVRSSNEASHRHIEREHRRAVRDAIERARLKLSVVEHRHSVTHSLNAAIEACDKIFAGLIALGHHYGTSRGSPPPPLPGELPTLLHVSLEEARHQILKDKPNWTSLKAICDSLATYARVNRGLIAHVALITERALHSLVRIDQQAAQRSGAVASQPPGGPRTNTLLAASPHALRVAVVVVIVYIAAHALALPFPYWATMAVVVVLQPQMDSVWLRMIERVVGSVIGGVAAAALCMVLHAPWEVVAVVFPLTAATIALRAVNYTLFVIFLTLLFVLVDHFIGQGLPSGGKIAVARAMDNAIGCLFSLAGGLLLWPDRPERSLPGKLVSAIAANLEYAAAVVGCNESHEFIESTRRSAGVSSNQAEDLLRRLLLERKRHSDGLDEASLLLATLRKLAGEVTAAWLASDACQFPARAAMARRYAELAANFRQLTPGHDPSTDALVPAVPALHPIDSVVEDVLRTYRGYRMATIESASSQGDKHA